MAKVFSHQPSSRFPGTDEHLDLPLRKLQDNRSSWFYGDGGVAPERGGPGDLTALTGFAVTFEVSVRDLGTSRPVNPEKSEKSNTFRTLSSPFNSVGESRATAGEKNWTSPPPLSQAYLQVYLQS